MVWAWSKREGAEGVRVEHEVGSLPGHEAKEGADGCQSGIAGSGAAASCVFHMIEEIQHKRFIDIFNAELLDILVQRVGRVAQQELHGITVSHKGMGCQAFLEGQVVAKETFDEVGKRGDHGVPPWGLT